jgi:hypothetical protein
MGVAHALLATATMAGPYAPAAGKPGSDAIAADDPRIRGWAAETTALVRGPEEIDDPFSLPTSYGSAASALGPADVIGSQDQPEPGTPVPKPAVSLGDGGSITLRFSPPIANGPGPDFAAFENGISFNGGSSFFMELAFAEVSSDGQSFVRFPAFSESPPSPQIGAYGAVDPTNVRNLAGKFVAGYGTPFDLDELAGTPGLNLGAITHVRIVDVVGSIDPRFARFDSLGRVINDPWPTFLTTSGFDLDAVAVLNQTAAGFPAWSAALRLPPALSGPEADPDADGVPNLLEYAFELPPLEPLPAPAITLALGPDGWIAHAPALSPTATDVVMEVEVSHDLQKWNLHSPSSPVILGPSTGPPAFCRLRLRLLSPP